MQYKGKSLNLREYVEEKHSENPNDKWWDDEGIVYACQDYIGSCDLSDDDIQFLKENELLELLNDDE